MPWRYRRRVRIFPGLTMNVGKTGVTSFSLGGRGGHLTFGRRGRRATVGLPGSGLSYSAYEPYQHRPAADPAPAVRSGLRLAVFIAILIVIALLGAAFVL